MKKNKTKLSKKNIISKKIRRGDMVKILVGKEKGKSGKVIKIITKKNKAIVEGLNLVKKHQKPKKSGETGDIVEIPAPINLSNLKLICPHCHQPTRVGFKMIDGQKKRICLKCKSVI